MRMLFRPLALFLVLACAGLALADDRHRLPPIRPLGIALDGKADATRFAQLEAYFFEANPTLMNRLDDLKKAVLAGEKQHGFTYLAAPAGAGKSFLFNLFAKQMADRLHKIDLAKMDNKPLPIRRVLDLHSVGVEDPARSSVILAFGKSSDPPRVQNCPPLLELFGAFGSDLADTPRPFLLIDSLDEIHPLSSLAVLERVDEFLKATAEKKPAGFVHVFVFGRAESFETYYRDRHPEKKPAIFSMNLPNYGTLTDLKVGLESSRVFSKLTEKDVEAALTLVPKDRFLAECVPFLNVQGDLLQGARGFIEKNANERQLKDALIGKMLERNAKVMYRSTIGADWYMHLLESIATSRCSVDANGYFSVG